jgi:hypothetical protein
MSRIGRSGLSRQFGLYQQQRAAVGPQQEDSNIDDEERIVALCSE